MRDCSRGDEVDQPLVKLIPLLCPSTSATKMPIERVSSAQDGSEEQADSHTELPVNAGQQIFFQSLCRTDLVVALCDPPWEDARGVPVVPNWFQALRPAGQRLPKESPRFDEVSTMATPREGGEFRTPGPTPRPDMKPSPREEEDTATGAAAAAARERGRPQEREPEISYEGTYLGTMKHGRGRVRMQNYTYEGEFQNDLKHGQGVLEWDDGRRYEGGFRENKFHGAAVMQWPDGRRYVGQYAEDRKHGQGTFSWQDGRRYEGQWVSGRRHGVGVYTNAKGFTRRGSWQQDRPIRWEDGAEHAAGTPLDAKVPSAQPEALNDDEEVIEVSTL
eukprot:g2779.t1